MPSLARRVATRVSDVGHAQVGHRHVAEEGVVDGARGLHGGQPREVGAAVDHHLQDVARADAVRELAVRGDGRSSAPAREAGARAPRSRARSMAFVASSPRSEEAPVDLDQEAVGGGVEGSRGSSGVARACRRRSPNTAGEGRRRPAKNPRMRSSRGHARAPGRAFRSRSRRSRGLASRLRLPGQGRGEGALDARVDVEAVRLEVRDRGRAVEQHRESTTRGPARRVSEPVMVKPWKRWPPAAGVRALLVAVAHGEPAGEQGQEVALQGDEGGVGAGLGLRAARRGRARRRRRTTPWRAGWGTARSRGPRTRAGCRRRRSPPGWSKETWLRQPPSSTKRRGRKADAGVRGRKVAVEPGEVEEILAARIDLARVEGRHHEAVADECELRAGAEGQVEGRAQDVSGGPGSRRRMHPRGKTGVYSAVKAPSRTGAWADEPGSNWK